MQYYVSVIHLLKLNFVSERITLCVHLKIIPFRYITSNRDQFVCGHVFIHIFLNTCLVTDGLQIHIRQRQKNKI